MFRNFWSSKKKQNTQSTVQQGGNYSYEVLKTTDKLHPLPEVPLPMIGEITKRVQQDFADNPTALADAQTKLAAITLRIVDEKYGNIVEIGGKTFSLLHADSRTEDVRQGVKQYSNLTYIKAAHRLLDGNYEEPYTLERLLTKVDRKMFNNIVAAEEFVDTYIPGATLARRVQNFSLLVGLPKCGYCNPYGFWTNLNTLGYAWISAPLEGMAGSLFYSKSEGGFFFHYLDLALPLICFVDSNDQGLHYPGSAITAIKEPVASTSGMTEQKLSDEDAYLRRSQSVSSQYDG